MYVSTNFFFFFKSSKQERVENVVLFFHAGCGVCVAGSVWLKTENILIVIYQVRAFGGLACARLRMSSSSCLFLNRS